MAETPAPLLAHNRIDANRRNTRLLLICFAVLMLPAAWGVSQLLLATLTMRAGAGLSHRASAIGCSGSAQPCSSVFMRGLPLAGAGPHEAVFGLFMAVVSTVTLLSIGYLTSLFSTFILWRHGARPLGNDHPELRRTVENLCVGVGLPPPKLYLTNSDTPNAFAIGFNPKSARLVVSRGLLALLDRRELSGVIAHELSHIANRDTNLSTLLGAGATVVRLPQTLCMGLLTGLRAMDPGTSSVILFFFGPTLLYLVGVFLASLLSLLLAPSAIFRSEQSFSQFLMMLLPIYILVLAPVVAVFLRKKISHEREFLADADAALLTNDPEGLALALAKVSAAVGVCRERDPATAHMFFIDPAPPTRFSWLRGDFPTHPDPEERIALLTRMGDGIVEGLTAASDAGVNYRGELLLRQYAPRKGTASMASRLSAGREKSAEVPASVTPQSLSRSQFPLIRGETPLYERPDGWSAILHTLSAGLIVTVLGFEGNFVHVHTERGEGYIPRGAIAASAAALLSHG